MKINTKKLIHISLLLIIAGAILTGIGMLFGGRPGVSFSRNGITSPYRQNEPYTLKKTKTDSFSHIRLSVESYADIRILPSEDGQFYLEYLLDGDYKEPAFDVTGDTLTLTQKDTHFGNIYFFNFSVTTTGSLHPYINLYIPKGRDMKDLFVFNDCGDLSVEHMAFQDAQLKNEFGNITLRNVSFADTRLTLESGSLKAEQLTADSLLIVNDFGDVTLKDSSAKKTDVKLESGQLEADTFTCDSFLAENEYGDIELTAFSADTTEFTLQSGTLLLEADKLDTLACRNEYGDVKLFLPKELSDYTIDAHTEYGSIRLPDKAPEGFYSSSGGKATYQTQGKRKGVVTVKAEAGDIQIDTM